MDECINFTSEVFLFLKTEKENQDIVVVDSVRYRVLSMSYLLVTY